jgi:hypothetical protein
MKTFGKNSFSGFGQLEKTLFLVSKCTICTAS